MGDELAGRVLQKLVPFVADREPRGLAVHVADAIVVLGLLDENLAVAAANACVMAVETRRVLRRALPPLLSEPSPPPASLLAAPRYEWRQGELRLDTLGRLPPPPPLAGSE